MFDNIDVLVEFEKQVVQRNPKWELSCYHTPNFVREMDKTTKLFFEAYAEKETKYRLLLPILYRSINKWSTVSQFPANCINNVECLRDYAKFIDAQMGSHVMFSTTSYIGMRGADKALTLFQYVWRSVAERADSFLDLMETGTPDDIYTYLCRISQIGKMQAHEIVLDAMTLRGTPDAWDPLMPTNFVSMALNFLQDRRVRDHLPDTVRSAEAELVKQTLNLPSMQYTSRLLAFFGRTYLAGDRGRKVYAVNRAFNDAIAAPSFAKYLEALRASTD